MYYGIGGEDRQRAQLSVGTSSEVSLKVAETDISSLSATIRSPSGTEDYCQLKRLQNGHLGKYCRAYLLPCGIMNNNPLLFFL